MRIDLYRETGYVGDSNDPSSGRPSAIPGDYRWRIWESSDVIGASTEGYKDRRDMIHNLLAVTGGTLKRRGDGLFLLRRTVRNRKLAPIPVRDETGDEDG